MCIAALCVSPLYVCWLLKLKIQRTELNLNEACDKKDGAKLALARGKRASAVFMLFGRDYCWFSLPTIKLDTAEPSRMLKILRSMPVQQDCLRADAYFDQAHFSICSVQ
jgi:hypothetical protein